jgi:hypothetical protein
MTATGDLTAHVRRRAMTIVGRLAAVGAIGVLPVAPALTSVASAAPSGGVAAAKCPVDHHVYATAKSAKRSGTSVKVRVTLGKADCGIDGPGFKFVKRVTVLTVHKGAVVKVLKNITESAKDARIPVADLPRYINRSAVKSDGNIFRVTGPHASVKDFVQVFIS